MNRCILLCVALAIAILVLVGAPGSAEGPEGNGPTVAPDTAQQPMEGGAAPTGELYLPLVTKEAGPQLTGEILSPEEIRTNGQRQRFRTEWRILNTGQPLEGMMVGGALGLPTWSSTIERREAYAEVVETSPPGAQRGLGPPDSPDPWVRWENIRLETGVNVFVIVLETDRCFPIDVSAFVQFFLIYNQEKEMVARSESAFTSYRITRGRCGTLFETNLEGPEESRIGATEEFRLSVSHGADFPEEAILSLEWVGLEPELPTDWTRVGNNIAVFHGLVEDMTTWVLPVRITENAWPFAMLEVRGDRVIPDRLWIWLEPSRSAQAGVIHLNRGLKPVDPGQPPW